MRKTEAFNNMTLAARQFDNINVSLCILYILGDRIFSVITQFGSGARVKFYFRVSSCVVLRYPQQHP